MIDPLRMKLGNCRVHKCVDVIMKKIGCDCSVNKAYASDQYTQKYQKIIINEHNHAKVNDHSGTMNIIVQSGERGVTSRWVCFLTITAPNPLVKNSQCFLLG